MAGRAAGRGMAGCRLMAAPRAGRRRAVGRRAVENPVEKNADDRVEKEKEHAAVDGAWRDEAPAPNDAAASESDAGDGDGLAAAGAGVGAFAGLAAVLALTVGATSYYHEEINAALDTFTDMLATQGYAVSLLEYSALYVVLELFAVPAIPLTMSAGALFGTPVGLAAASFSSTLAATVAFLGARYVARDRVAAMIEGNPKLMAIDQAVSRDGFRVVALLRLSPLLPFALSNYAYGVSSVPLREYVLASWLGMLPGTAWFVYAGSLGRSVLSEGVDSGAGAGAVALALSFGVSVLSGGYVARLVRDATSEPA